MTFKPAQLKSSSSCSIDHTQYYDQKTNRNKPEICKNVSPALVVMGVAKL